jgi:hypothetical protein
MEDARSYMECTAPAAEGMFRLLNEYGWQKVRSIADLTKSKTSEELERYTSEFTSTDVAREIIAGSILQIAYFAIDRFGARSGKSKSAVHFETEINRLIRETPNTRWKKKEPFTLPERFCVGRDIGDVPLGVVVYAGRNQYNHFGEKRLGVLNEVVFNHLDNLLSSPSKEISFNLYDEKRPRSFSVLAALGWTDSSSGLGYAAYKKDLCKVMQLEC